MGAGSDPEDHRQRAWLNEFQEPRLYRGAAPVHSFIVYPYLSSVNRIPLFTSYTTLLYTLMIFFLCRLAHSYVYNSYFSFPFIPNCSKSSSLNVLSSRQRFKSSNLPWLINTLTNSMVCSSPSRRPSFLPASRSSLSISSNIIYCASISRSRLILFIHLSYNYPS